MAPDYEVQRQLPKCSGSRLRCSGGHINAAVVVPVLYVRKPGSTGGQSFPMCSGGAIGAAVDLQSAAVSFCGAAVAVRCARIHVF